jgi:CDP-diacylglycerol--glycerol-3-phosphate 3-phosphatidyltransferase
VTGSLVSQDLRQRVRGIATPIATGLGRLGLTPNHLTLIGFGIAVVSAVAAAGQAWLLAGLLLSLGGAFDLLDGALARATGRTTKLGAFMDSVFDRAGEAVVYVGIAAGCISAGFGAGAIWAAAAMGAAFMVSYTRAKSESLGFTSGTGMAAVGAAPREVRLIVLALGLILAPSPLHETLPVGAACAGPCDFPQGGTLGAALVVIAAGATITTIQRILHVVHQSSSKERL